MSANSPSASLLQVIGLNKSFGARQLLEDVDFYINEGEHIGVIGPNGAGKTTLFKLICELEEADSGRVVTKRGLIIGYLQQHDTWKEGESAESFLERGTTLPIWEIKSLGIGLGLSEELYQQPVLSLSGGFRMRLKLLHLLGQEPDILLLDEPTNYLDLESILVLERFLQEYKKTFLLISHDREFLRRCTDHTLEVEDKNVVKYPGSIDDYFEQKALMREQLEAQAVGQAQKRKAVMDFVNRFGAKATKARQAQSKLKSLEKMEKIEIKPLASRAAIHIPAPPHCGKEVLQIRGLDLGYGAKTVLKNINLTVMRGDHIGVVGVNGIGKSTFLKGLCHRLKPMAGQVKHGYEVKVAYYGQHVGEELDLDHNVIESMMDKAHVDVLPQDVKNLAGSLLFSGDDAKKKVRLLSGGERARVALGQVLLQKAPVLLLDEPTNHLDFDTVEALTQALHSFEGTVVVVSHDRGFVSRVARQIFEIRDGKVDNYPGSYDEYVWSLQKGSWGESQAAHNSGKANKVEQTDGSQADAKPTKRHLRKEEQKQLRRLEREIEKYETRVQQLQSDVEKLSQELTEGSGDTLKLTQDLAYLQKDLDETEHHWLELMEKREGFDV